VEIGSLAGWEPIKFNQTYVFYDWGNYSVQEGGISNGFTFENYKKASAVLGLDVKGSNTPGECWLSH
jgi:hypothetical protein